MGKADRFSYPYLSGDATFGELATRAKTLRLATDSRDTLLDLLGSLYCTKQNGTRRSGVIEGLDVYPHATLPMTVRVNTGLGLYYNAVEDLAGRLAIQPVVCNNEAAAAVTLDNPDGTHPRYDVIVARPDPALANYATRQVMLADGTKATQSLPDRWKESIEVVAIKGTAAASPVAPACDLYDIPLAVVSVPAGAPGLVDVANIVDVRPFVSPVNGSTSNIGIVATIDGSTAAVTAYQMEIADKTIKEIAGSEFARNDVGEYEASLSVPSTFGSVSDAFWFKDVAVCNASLSFTGVGGTRNVFVQSRAYFITPGRLKIRVRIFDASGTAVDVDGDCALSVLVSLFKV